MTFPVFYRNPQHVVGRYAPSKTCANWCDRSKPAGLDVHVRRREWQPHAEDLGSSWKCKVRQVSSRSLMRNIKWLFEGSPLPFMFPSLSLLVLRWTFHPQPASLPVCVLWTAHTVLLKGRVIKRPFMRARSLWWGCHFVQCSAPSLRNFRQAWPHPCRRTEWWTGIHVDPRVDAQTVRYQLIPVLWSNLVLKPGNCDSWLRTCSKQLIGKGCWQDLDNLKTF